MSGKYLSFADVRKRCIEYPYQEILFCIINETLISAPLLKSTVRFGQWLHTTDGRLKLGDFNRATIMQWDTIKGEYCKFNNGEAFANYRAPEEFAARNLNEQIDTFSFGNNIYAMLTGLWNFVSIILRRCADKLPYNNFVPD